MHQTRREQAPDADAHLAQDWDLFQTVESGGADLAFRMWEVVAPVVVVGRSTSIPEQVVQEACRADGVPVLRRFSGGGAVVLGPGCLNYAVGLSLVSRPDLTAVGTSFLTILGGLTAALGVAGLIVDGGTDLVVDGRKVSGNAQRRGRRALLHHGTLLYAFDPALAERYLREPRRRPPYRATRTHAEFMGNLPLSADALRVRAEAGLAALGRPTRV
jgi:lipoate-protein ligase A